jgi:hypothetical protein
LENKEFDTGIYILYTINGWLSVDQHFALNSRFWYLH